MPLTDKPSSDTIRDLLAQRRHEGPPPEYWQEFLQEFHRSQQQQTHQKSAFARWASSLSQRFAELGSTKWAYACGLAYAAVTAAFLLTPRDAAPQALSPTPVNYETVITPIPELNEPARSAELLTPLPALPSAPGVKTDF
jgi:hypothetical protein